MPNHDPDVLPRSFLYVPAVRPELFTKATQGASDALILDLEDAVPMDRKAEAREHVAHWLGEAPVDTGEMPGVWVRVNADALAEDLDAVTRPALDGILLAKCTAETLDRAAELLAEREEERGVTVGRTRVIGLVESAQGLLELAVTTRHPRMVSCGIGEADLLADLRITRSRRSAATIDTLRSQVVVHCAAAGLSAPVAPTSTDFRDLAAFVESSRHLLDLGFRSRSAIHPAQVSVINEVFSPDPASVEAARDVLERFESAAGGVTTDARGRLIDAAVVRAARETLGRHRR